MCIYLCNEAVARSETGVSCALQTGGNFTVWDCIRLLGGRQQNSSHSQHITWRDCTLTAGPRLRVKKSNQTTEDYHSVVCVDTLLFNW